MNKGWFKQINLDPAGLGISVLKSFLGGDFDNVWKLLRDSGTSQAIRNSIVNTGRSIATFIGGEDLVNNIRGGVRWATDTFDWLRGLGRR